jgi:hypothetical protein
MHFAPSARAKMRTKPNFTGDICYPSGNEFCQPNVKNGTFDMILRILRDANAPATSHTASAN